MTPLNAGSGCGSACAACPLGDSAVVISIADTISADIARRVRGIAAEIERRPPAGVVDVVPAFGRIALFFEAAHMAPWESLVANLEALVARADAVTATVEVRTVEIPVCYGGEYGPDLAEVATHANRSIQDVVALHAGADYTVHAIGFSPGFPYLGGMPPELATPRRASPRPRVPAGSVGIGGVQSGIYSLETPGGWNLIGRTPWRMFDANRREPSVLQAGDRVRFHVIRPEEFETLQQAGHDAAAAAMRHDAVESDAAETGAAETGAAETGAVADAGRACRRSSAHCSGCSP